MTAGIDFALTLVAEIYGEDLAKTIQLSMEYNPDPPFNSGHPDVAEPEITRKLKTLIEKLMKRRRDQSKKIGDAKP